MLRHPGRPAARRRLPHAVVRLTLCVATTALVASCSLMYSADRYDSESTTTSPPASPDGDAGSADGPLRDAPGSEALAGCVFKQPVHHALNPSTRAELFTVSLEELAASLASGSEDRGIAFYAATTSPPGADFSPVYRYLNPSTGDRLYTGNPTEGRNAASLGYTADEGIVFYAAAEGGGACVVPIQAMAMLGRHTLTTSEAEQAKLEAQGWHKDGVRFYAGILP